MNLPIHSLKISLIKLLYQLFFTSSNCIFKCRIITITLSSVQKQEILIDKRKLFVLLTKNKTYSKIILCMTHSSAYWYCTSFSLTATVEDLRSNTSSPSSYRIIISSSVTEVSSKSCSTISESPVVSSTISL